MKQTIIILFSMLTILASCNKDEEAPPEVKFIVGTVEDILVQVHSVIPHKLV